MKKTPPTPKLTKAQSANLRRLKTLASDYHRVDFDQRSMIQVEIEALMGEIARLARAIQVSNADR